MNLSARLYLATAESCTLQLLLLFAVVYSQQMRKLKQTHRLVPQPQVSCSTCTFQPASNIIYCYEVHRYIECVSKYCHYVCYIPVISLSRSWMGDGWSFIFLEVLLTPPLHFTLFPSSLLLVLISSWCIISFAVVTKSYFFGLCFFPHISIESVSRDNRYNLNEIWWGGSSCFC